jgi:cytochrome c
LDVKAIVSFVVFAVAVLSGTGAAVAQDSAAGKAAFSKCQACHAVGAGAKNKLGPELNGLDGRKTGAAAGYQYSPALKNAGFAWEQASFAEFMQNPRAKVPRNKMAFAGMKDQSEIASLWAYLAHFNADGSSK